MTKRLCDTIFAVALTGLALWLVFTSATLPERVLALVGIGIANLVTRKENDE